MTELALRGPEMAVARPGRRSLVEWQAEMVAAATIARGLAGTSFCPASLRVKDNPDATMANMAAALLAGTELGLEPMAALRSFVVVNGTPALTALALRGIIQSRGHELWVDESTATRAIVRGRRSGSAVVHTSTWTIDRARGLGIAGRDNWRNQPIAMLVARATAECARYVAADVLLGLPYIAEEMGDPDPEPTPAKTTRRARRDPPSVEREEADGGAVGLPTPTRAPPPAPDEPPLEDEPPDPPVIGVRTVDLPPDHSPAPINLAQQTAIMAGLREIGISDRAERLGFMATVLGHDVRTTQDLTRREASAVLDQIDTLRSITTEPEPGGDT